MPVELVRVTDPAQAPTASLPPAHVHTGGQYTIRNTAFAGPWLSVVEPLADHEGQVVTRLAPGEAGVFYSTGDVWHLVSRTAARTIVFRVDGGGSSIGSGAEDVQRIPFAGVLMRYSMHADAVGSAVVDVQRAPWPATPTAADSVCRGLLPTLSGQQTRLERAEVLKWDGTFPPESVLRCVVLSASGIGHLRMLFEFGLL
jgi:hypothetical protein